MNKIQIVGAVEVFAGKDFQNIEVVETMDVHFCYQSGEAPEEDNKGTDLCTREINAAMGDLDTLLDYIIDTHHQFVREKAVMIYDLSQKVAYRHGRAHPELNELAETMFFFLHDLLNHMTREEHILFPNIRQLVKNNNQSEKGKYTTFGLIKEWVRLMQKEHRSVCKSLKLLNDLTNNYSLPTDACDSYRSLFRLMLEFEVGFLLLVHIQNDILFPKALVEDGEPY